MITILQAHLNRSKTANDLLTQIIYEKQADLLILSEQYQDRHSETWFKNTLGMAAIWVTNPTTVPVVVHGSEKAYVWVRSGCTTFVSCYLTPNEPIEDFQTKLEGLEETIQGFAGGIVLAGEFNGKAVEWGMIKPDSRGKRIVETAARRGLIVLSAGATTLRRLGKRETTPDISLVSEDLARYTENWTIMDDFTGGDHQYITFQLETMKESPKSVISKPIRWNTKKLNEEKFRKAITRSQHTSATGYEGTDVKESSKLVVQNVMTLIRRACDVAMVDKRNSRAQKNMFSFKAEGTATDEEAG